MSGFLIERSQDLGNPPKKAGARIDPDMETMCLWKNYLSQTNLTNLDKKYKAKTLSGDIMAKVKKNNRYIFCIIRDQSE